MKINPLAAKSISRNLVVGLGFVESGAKTYLSSGAHFGLNSKTIAGVTIQTALVAVAFATRYFDKRDPAFGKITDQISSQLSSNLTKRLPK